MTAEPRISVVVCAYNSEARLPAALGALRRQTLGDADYEVIVVDDGSTDRTAAIAEEAGVRVIVQRENRGLAAARNAGWTQARAGLIAFTDDDCEPAPNWLEELIAGFGDPTVDGVSGFAEPVAEDGPLLPYLKARNPLAPLPGELLASSGLRHRLGLYLRGLLAVGEDAQPSGELFSVVGANMAFRRELLESVGGFDEVFRFGGEEEELCRLAHRRSGGARFVYRPQAVVRHWFEPDLKDTLRRARAYGRGNGRTASKHDDVRVIVFPFPVAIAGLAALALATRRWRLLAAVPLLPPAAYAGWSLLALRRRRPIYLAYPYVQLAQETATMLGEVDGVRAGYPAGRSG